MLIEGESDNCTGCFFDLDGASLGNEEGWLEAEFSPLGTRLGSVDIEGRILSLLLEPVLIEGEPDGCRDCFAAIDVASLGDEEG